MDTTVNKETSPASSDNSSSTSFDPVESGTNMSGSGMSEGATTGGSIGDDGLPEKNTSPASSENSASASTDPVVSGSTDMSGSSMSGSGMASFDSMDTNKDGLLSRAEYDAKTMGMEGK
jgi:hypothetical protein